ncbi:MAG: hypothetical protein WCW01_02110 [Gammaproteobacteria bacterium]
MFNPLHNSPLFLAVKQYGDERDPTKLGERSQAILRTLFNNGAPLDPQQVLAIWQQVPSLHLQQGRFSAVERLFQGYLPSPTGHAGPLPILPRGALFIPHTAPSLPPELGRVSSSQNTTFAPPRSIQPPLHEEQPASSNTTVLHNTQ